MAQAVWQDWISNAIAKTINMPNDVSVEDVKAAYLLSHELGLKGITVYRDGSRHKQVLHMTGENSEKKFDVTPSDFVKNYISTNIKNAYVKSQIDNALSAVKLEEIQRPMQSVQEDEKEETLCPVCKNKLIFAEGCNICIDCGYSGCTSG
jgi:ribonucleoside-diphosphate reductase alpha chain